MMRHGPNSQRGVALIVALVILVLVTLAGVATMQSTGMELKMSNADQDHQQAFEAAETALRRVESLVQQDQNGWVDQPYLYSECSGTGCFKADCPDGLCFEGVYSSSLPNPQQCSTVDTSVTSNVVPPYYDSSLDVWNDSGRHGVVDLSSLGYTNKVKYIIEFRCFVPTDPLKKLGANNGSELFRITVRAKSNSGNAEVMLQSVYKLL